MGWEGEGLRARFRFSFLLEKQSSATTQETKNTQPHVFKAVHSLAHVYGTRGNGLCEACTCTHV